MLQENYIEMYTDILKKLNEIDLNNIPPAYALELKKNLDQTMHLYELTQISMTRTSDMIKNAIVMDAIAKCQK